FYIAEYDAARDILTFPYFVDKYDVAPEGRPPGRGLTAYVLRTGKPLLATPQEFDDLKKSGEVESVGAPSVDWLGVPLATSGRIVDANIAAAEFYGWSVDTLRSMYIWQINMLDEGDIRSEMTNASQQRRSYFVFRHRLATGDIRDVEVHSGPIVTGGRSLL